jgi:hypothetical protein
MAIGGLAGELASTVCACLRVSLCVRISLQVGLWRTCRSFLRPGSVGAGRTSEWLVFRARLTPTMLLLALLHLPVLVVLFLHRSVACLLAGRGCG